MKIYKRNIVLIFLTILVSLLALELFLRIIDFNQYKLKGYPFKYFIKDEKLGFDINKNGKKFDFIFKDSKFKVWGNEIGCFDRKINNNNEYNLDEYILVIGDSLAWGFVPLINNWGSLLENKLNMRILKCGVPGFSTVQELKKTKKILKIMNSKPKVIILQYTFNNDFLGDYLYPEFRVENKMLTINNYLLSLKTGEIVSKRKEKKIWKQIKYNLNQHIYLFRLLHRSQSKIRKSIKYTIRDYKKSKDSYNYVEEKKSNYSYFNSFFFPYLDHEEFSWVEREWLKHLNRILEFKNISDIIGAKLLFVFWGDLPDYSHHIFKKAKKDNLPIKLNNEEKLFSFLKENNINYLNLSKSAWDFVGYKSLTDPGEKLRGKLIWENDNHFNIDGNKFMFEKVYNKLIEDKIIK